MNSTHKRERKRQFDRAARGSLARLRRDRKKLPEKLQILLEVMERDLFDPELDITTLKERCGIRDNSVPIRFHAAIGRPPHAYLEDRRMETACLLLSGSSLKVWEIAEMTGYSSLQVFSRAFLRWSGERPTQFRNREQQTPAERGGKAGAAGMADDAAKTEMLLVLRQAVRGKAEEDQVAQVVRHLLELYPELGPRALEATGGAATHRAPNGKAVHPRPKRTPDDADARRRNGTSVGTTGQRAAGEDHAARGGEPETGTDEARLAAILDPRTAESTPDDPEEAAQAVWSRLSRMPPPQQRAFIGRHGPRTLHLVELLLDESRKLDTTDPSRAVAVADLAVAAAEATIPNLGADHDAAALMARVWTRLGEALQGITPAG